MDYIPRQLTPQLHAAARAFPAVLVTGPRRAGKTTLLRRAFPRATHYLLEDPDLIARFRADPRTFIDDIELPAILDEIQHVPEVLNYVRTVIDRAPQHHGQWLLTGSQEAPLMRGVTESLAGRAAVFELLPLGRAETDRVSLLNGGFPEVLAQPDLRQVWFRSFVRTYLERDVRAVTAIRDLATYRRFLALLASRCGQLLNRTEIAAPLGVSVPTLSAWLSVLEVTAQVVFVPPFYENFGKRLVKSPKLYFVDSGLACHLLGIDAEATLKASPFLGALFEGFVAAEILKHQANAGRDRALYYFRDRQGLEVDFLLDLGNRHLALIEAKATRTPVPRMADGLLRLGRAIQGYDLRRFVVHLPGPHPVPTAALCPGVRALSLDRLGELWT